jgi:hypothetical protein
LDLLTNATVVEDAIRFVQSSKDKLICSNQENGKDFKEPDHGQELEQKQEEEEIKTTNQAF